MERYQKKNELIRSRRGVVSFMGYDTQLGLEVTWHEVDTSNYSQDDLDGFMSYLSMRESLKSLDIIADLAHWESERKVIVITESTKSATIWDRVFGEVFGEARSPPRPIAVSKWFFSVLKALKYLHSQGIVHKHVELTNMYIKSGASTVKLSQPPEFKIASQFTVTTPPEFFTGAYQTGSDIWQVGITILEALTGKLPYQECKTPMELISRIQSCTAPELLDEVADQNAKDLIKMCLAPLSERPTAGELLLHQFFTESAADGQQSLNPTTHIEFLFENKAPVVE